MSGKCPKSCIYSYCDHGKSCCQYILITGHRRPCPPGKGCTVYDRGKRLPPKPVAASPSNPAEREKRPRLSRRELSAQGNVLRELRREAGLTQSEVSRAARVCKNTYMGWELGRHAANWKLLEAVFPDGAARYEKRKGGSQAHE